MHGIYSMRHRIRTGERHSKWKTAPRPAEGGMSGDPVQEQKPMS